MPFADYNHIASEYDAARGMASDDLAAYHSALSPWLPPESGLPIVDIGSGTGQFAALLAEWFHVDVVGVEPSAAMRERAPAHPRVRYLGGRGEKLPLDDDSCGAAWLSTVVHHLDDLDACAREVRRVVVPSGPVLIRGSFPGRHEGITLFRYFPEASDVASTFPTVERVEEAFGAVGFERQALFKVPQRSASSLKDFLERVGRRADSTLIGISNRAFEDGLARLEADVAAEGEPGPVVDELDALVLA